MNECKVYWAGCSSSNDLGRGSGFRRQVGDGIHPGNESGNDSAVFRGTAGKLCGDLRGRDLRRLAARSAQAACGQTAGLRSAEERSAESGNKNDRIDARKLADLLRGNPLKPVYHGENGVRTLKELARSYLADVKDLTRVMNRLKALYRSWAIPCAGRDVYSTRHRAEWLGKIQHAGVRRRAELLYQQLDVLQQLRQQVRRDLLAESRKHPATAKLRQIPYLGPIRAALLVALIQTPHRFRTKRQLWAYSGLALKTYSSGEYRYVEGQLQRSKKLLPSVGSTRTTTMI